MKWLKHMTATRRDEKIAAFMDGARNPIEAYGFWWMVLEIVAEQMEPGDEKCSVTYSLPHWSRLLYSHHHKVITLLGNLEGNGLVTLQYGSSNGVKLITVTIPNLLKYRDEYSRKSGQSSGATPDTLLTKKETKKEKETKNKKIPPSGTPDYTLGFVAFWDAWPRTQRKTAKAACFKKWIGKELEKQVDTIVAHIDAWKKTDQWRSGYEPAPLTYLNQARWLDGPPPPDTSEPRRPATATPVDNVQRLRPGEYT